MKPQLVQESRCRGLTRAHQGTITKPTTSNRGRGLLPLNPSFIFSSYSMQSKIFFFFKLGVLNSEPLPASPGCAALQAAKPPPPRLSASTVPPPGSRSSSTATGKLGLMEINLPTTVSVEFAHLLYTASQTGSPATFC